MPFENSKYYQMSEDHAIVPQEGKTHYGPQHTSLWYFESLKS